MKTSPAARWRAAVKKIERARPPKLQVLVNGVYLVAAVDDYGRAVLTRGGEGSITLDEAGMRALVQWGAETFGERDA